jgi:hypothetical protein
MPENSNSPSSASSPLSYAGFSLTWSGRPLVPPFLYGPGLALLALIVTDILLRLPAVWSVRYLGCVEVYGIGSAAWLLYLQREAGADSESSHEYWRLRTILWGLLATSVAGLVLTVFRGYPAIPSALIPVNQYPTTELGALALTIAILAMLSRYTVMTSKSDTADVASALTHIGEVLGSGFTALATKFDEFLSARRSETDDERIRRERVLFVHVHVDKAGWLHHRARADIRAGPEGFSRCEVEINQSAVAGTGGRAENLSRGRIETTSAGAGQTFDLGDVSELHNPSFITVNAAWWVESGTRYHGAANFTYRRSGIFSFRLDPDFEVELTGAVG